MKIEIPNQRFRLGDKRISCLILRGEKDNKEKALMMTFYRLRLPYEGENLKEDTEQECKDPLFGIEFTTKRSVRIFQYWLDVVKSKIEELPE